jgi:hypothetical protein
MPLVLKLGRFGVGHHPAGEHDCRGYDDHEERCGGHVHGGQDG